MLERPNIADEKIVACLREAYGLDVAQIAFLPLGADAKTAVFHLTTPNQTDYFLKLRSGHFDKTAVLLPRLLHDQGHRHIIPPLPTQSGNLWATLDSYKTILFPFVSGKNGYEVALMEAQWVAFGTAVKQLHTAKLPAELVRQLPAYPYTPRWRERVRAALAYVAQGKFVDGLAAETAVFLRSKQDELADLIARAERLAPLVQAKGSPPVVCHADLHAGNLLLTENGTLYLVDWDTLTLAPKERDLMFVGGGLLGGKRPFADEISLFYQGYGPSDADPAAVAYYRYERILEDIALFADDLLHATAPEADRRQSFHYLKANFLPNDTLELAIKGEENFKT